MLHTTQAMLEKEDIVLCCGTGSAPSQHFTPGTFFSREPALPQKPPSTSVGVQATEGLTPYIHTRLGKKHFLGVRAPGVHGGQT